MRGGFEWRWHRIRALQIFLSTFTFVISLAFVPAVKAGDYLLSQLMAEKYFKQDEECESTLRTVFIFGATRIAIHPSWLTNTDRGKLYQQTGRRCPSGPLFASDGIHFNDAVLQLAGIRHGFGRRTLSLLSIRNISPNWKYGFALTELNSLKPVQDKVEVSDVSARYSVSETSRSYLIRYPESEFPNSTNAVIVGCAGSAESPPGRSCFSHSYLLLGDLQVGYRVSQGDLPWRNVSTPSDLAREIDGVLEFDSKIRNWIRSLIIRP